MKTIRLSDKLEVPLLDFATQATAALGIKGSGKSQDMGYMAEQLMTAGAGHFGNMISELTKRDLVTGSKSERKLHPVFFE